MAMVVASSSRILNSLQRQSTLVAGSKVRPIWSVNVPTVERTTHNSKTANASTLTTESGRKNAFSTTCGDGSEFASMTTTTTTTTSRRRSTIGRRRQHKISTPRAEKRNEDGSIEDDDSSNSSFLSMELLLQTVIVVFTLGFIDAGYSGDWSRIGALSKEKEELLRIAAYGVVPLSAATVWAIGNRSKSSM
ncbi:unnamed protein product [Sphagnum troendelagicum]|uniref:DUF7887 domain-containing protein n=1 Tax=Sphagnum troendelagicum TaxID=128251 RepID=A0ABP0U9J2_9BRYO